MSNPQNHEPKSNSEEMLIAMIVIVLVLSFVISYFLHNQIVHLVAIVRTVEIWLIDTLTFGWFTSDLVPAWNWLMKTPIESMDWLRLNAAGIVFGSYWRWIATPLLLTGSWWAWSRDIAAPFRRKLDLENFIKLQSKRWKALLPIVVENPADDKSGRWAIASSIEEWMEEHKIPVAPEAFEQWLAASTAPAEMDPTQIKDRYLDAIRTALARQLGPVWGGSADLPPHLRCLFAAFALKAARKREKSQELLDRLNEIWATKGHKAKPKAMDKALLEDKVLMGEVNRTLLDPAAGGQAERIANLHAYQISAVLSVLQWARKRGGVLAPAEFLWLKPYNRPAWYALNGLGTNTHLVEACGALAHWKVEAFQKRPIPDPQIEEALVGIIDHLSRKSGIIEHIDRMPGKKGQA